MSAFQLPDSLSIITILTLFTFIIYNVLNMRVLNVDLIKIFLNIILVPIGMVFFSSCDKEKEDMRDDTGWESSTGMGHEETGDYSWDEASVIHIALNGNTISTSSENVSVNGSNAVIHSEGNYLITGTLTNGSLIVDTDIDALVRLILKDVSIHNGSGPAILIEKSRKTIISLDGDSQNLLTDGTLYANPNDDPNAALFSKSDLTIFGTGSLSVDGNYNDAITGKDGLIVKSGNITVTSVDDGIRGKDYLIVDSPNITINSGGDGLKSDNEDNNITGQVLMYGGSVNATTGGDGITGGNNVIVTSGFIHIVTGGGNTKDTSSLSQKGIKAGKSVKLLLDSMWIDAVDHAIDSDGTIEINGGNYSLYSARAGIHSNVSTIVDGGSLSIIRSMEGFESKNIVINGGTIKISSIDDCFSATEGYDVDVDDGSFVGINDGYLVLNCMRGDGIDSNGSIEMKGGKVIIHGPPAAPEVAVDFNKSFDISGGFLAGSGTNSELLEYPDTTSSQNSLMAIFAEQYPASTIFNISDNEGNQILTFQPSGQYQSVLFTSPLLETGKSYYLDIEGTSTGTNIDGLIEDGTYTPGNRMSMITINSRVTILNNLKSSEDEE